MLRSEFQYDLPRQRIARYPPRRRGESRLLCLDLSRDTLHDARFSDLPRLLRSGDLLVANDSRVIPARLEARKQTGGRVEILLERWQEDGEALALLRCSRRPAPGAALWLDSRTALRLVAWRGCMARLRILRSESGPCWETLLQRYGHVPIPPYLGRPAEDLDRERYQTIYARRPGAVAAPTAGLHFTLESLDRLGAAGVELAYVTLHVGAGTFLPLREDQLATERLHMERYQVSEQVCGRIRAARARGARVLAIGTTSLRCLETAAAAGDLRSGSGETDLFIKPGYRFQVVDGLLTNFHLPQSSLLMLVCALGGCERVLAAYRHAVRSGYRFYSYGDAMLLAPNLAW